VIALDLSRLLSRAGSATPTGIDRVELAYARQLISGTAPCCFTARNAIGGIGLLPQAAVAQFVGLLAGLWRDGFGPGQQHSIAVLLHRLGLAAIVGGPALRDAMRRSVVAPTYLLVSHQNLDRPRPIKQLKAAGARFACLIHDLIPLDFPHLTRPGQARRHHRRIAAVAALADVVIANSTATRDALLTHLRGRQMSIEVAALGIDLPDVRTPPPAEHPYFVCIGTIEARKNQGLLLDLWRRLASELGDRAPHLWLIGRRGFGGEHLAEQLKPLRGLVIEQADLPDATMARLLCRARALLLPSFAEGFGLPMVEALAQGVPVLCSDMPALREAGGGVPDYLVVSDHAAWHRAVIEYVMDSPSRQAQLARLARWRAPSWADHFAIVGRLIPGFGSSAGDAA
jgi:glycosyltransferase involved in cell wall biosynthesis